MLTILDEHTRERHVPRPERALRASDVLAWLERAIQAPRCARVFAERQRPGVHRPRGATLARQQPDQDDLHRSGQSLAKWLCRKFPRPLPGRVPHRKQLWTLTEARGVSATGEETYSFAMLLVEHARALENLPTIQVFG